MGAALSQVFPPAPTLTEKNLPDQTGKVLPTQAPTSPPTNHPQVFIVTGSS